MQELRHLPDKFGGMMAGFDWNEFYTVFEKKMKKAAAELNFEAAAEYRDKLIMLKNTLRDVK